MLILAQKGDIAATAAKWLCRYNGGEDEPASDAGKAEFIGMLLAREKLTNDVFTAFIAPAMTCVTTFTLFDEKGGNYQAAQVVTVKYAAGPGPISSPDERRYTSNHFVVALRFRRSDLVEAFDLGTAKARKSGRPKGAGGWAAQDDELVKEMEVLIAGNPGMSVHGAAGQLAERAAGNAGLDTKQKRLAGRYRKMHRQ